MWTICTVIDVYQKGLNGAQAIWLTVSTMATGCYQKNILEEFDVDN